MTLRPIFGAAFAAAAFLFAARSYAQDPLRQLVGTVVRAEQPVAGVPVTLHRVTPDASGPVGEARTDAGGRFRFALPAADTTAFEVFFATAEYQTVRYFGSPIHGGAPAADYAIAVFDTAHALPGAIRVARRDIVLIPEPQGGWEANEIIRLANDGDRTLVAEPGMPTWETTLPEGITDFQAGEGEFTAAEIGRMGDRLLWLAPLIPGETQMMLRYRIAEGLEEAILPVAMRTDTFNVFVGQPSLPIEVAGLTSTQVVNVQGEQFVQYGRTDLASGEAVGLTWDAPLGAPVSPEVAGVVAAALVLAAGSWFAFQHRAGQPEHAARGVQPR